jgi:chemotaxis protein histidine kinase CheA
MSRTKSQKPAVVTYFDHEVITPPNKLRHAISTTRGDQRAADPVARAEQALAQLSSEFSGWMDTECERLDQARHLVKTIGFNRATHEALFHAAHDIKGEAATFGFPWIASLAESLSRLVEHTPDMHRIPLTLVDQHVDAIRAMIRESGRPDIAALADTLTRRLREVTDEFLAYENRERPDYLDGIVAPPIAPNDPSF